jgi:hypothetical protein
MGNAESEADRLRPGVGSHGGAASMFYEWRLWGHMSTTDLPGPSLLAGRYRLVERLGSGGMSVVWRGFDEVLGRQVAVKVLPRANSADPAFRRRLRAEAQAAARLSHPHITNVYDYGEATPASDGAPLPFVVMELVDGESLAVVLSRARVLPWPVAVRICAEVAAALAVAHARGIVHRDVTPANVMLTASGAKVVDFGISALIGENDIDPDGSLLGTPAYLAPERLVGGQVSPATDVYAVGLLIYRTLIGQLPWDVGTTTALLRAHQYTEPEPLPPVEGLPPAVSALVGRCLEKLPDDRPSSAELAHILAAVVAEAPHVARVRAPWADDEGDTTILPWQLATADVPRLPLAAPPSAGPPSAGPVAVAAVAPLSPVAHISAGTAAIAVAAGSHLSGGAIYGGQAAPAAGSSVPVSAVPLSAVPVSGAPVSAAPVSVSPASAAPVSAAPVSAAPFSAVPFSAAAVVSAVPASAAIVADGPVPGEPGGLGGAAATLAPPIPGMRPPASPDVEGVLLRPAAFGNGRPTAKVGPGANASPGAYVSATAGTTAVPSQRAGRPGPHLAAIAQVALAGTGHPDAEQLSRDGSPDRDSSEGGASGGGAPGRGARGPGARGRGADQRSPDRNGGDGQHGPLEQAGGAGHGAGGGPGKPPGAGSPPGDLDGRRPGGPTPGERLPRHRRVLLVAGAVVAVGAVAYGLNALAGDGKQGGGIAQAAVPEPRNCFVTYAMLADTGKTFRAGVFVTNGSASPIDDWDLRFVMPGDQQVAGKGAVTVKQEGVDVTASSSSVIQPQRTVQVTLTGGYRGSNAVPVLFTLNGRLCDAFVSPKPGEPARLVPTTPGTGVNPRGFPVAAPAPGVPRLSTGPGGVVVTVPADPTATTTGVPATGPTTPVPTTTATASPTPPPEPPTPVTTHPTTPVTESPPPIPPDEEPSHDGVLETITDVVKGLTTG